MAISINHNLLAVNTANNLSHHYSELAVSTRRLSSGLRINGAADDAAGLAIRELMRSDIAALNQGVRNCNDAISMIQTFDGALSVIDEKLIRMKELAEQAATGTYDSTQRLMIDSEFQAMGSEINRIARATDFNGIKLINGDFAAAAAPGGTPIQKTYSKDATGTFVNAQFGGAATQGTWDVSGITDEAKLVGTRTITITNDSVIQIGDKYLMVNPASGAVFPDNTHMVLSYDPNAPDAAFTGGWHGTVNGVDVGPSGNASQVTLNFNGGTYQFYVTDANGGRQLLNGATGDIDYTSPARTPSYNSNAGPVTATQTGDQLKLTVDLGNGNSISNTWTITAGNQQAVTSATVTLTVKDTTPKPNNPGGGDIPDDVIKIHFGTLNDSAEDYYYINKHDATLKGLGLDGVAIQTQDDAQGALVTIDNAIVEKDKIRAEYGAMQNRLENTVTNLRVQAENLQAAESRISDSEIATEMMNFVRNQILTQSAVAMLAQANSMPQMVMRLISG